MKTFFPDSSNSTSDFGQYSRYLESVLHSPWQQCFVLTILGHFRKHTLRFTKLFACFLYILTLPRIHSLMADCNVCLSLAGGLMRQNLFLEFVRDAIQSWSREADIMRLGWIAMYLLYTLSRSIWILWQCMAITARSDSLSVASCSLTTCGFFSHKRTTSPPLCCLSVIQLESSVALLCWEKTNYLHGLTEGQSQTRRPVPSAGSSLSIEIVRFQGRTRRGASVPTLLEILLLTLIFPRMS